ncbi:MAG TPA: hypothetical protein VF710_17105 [Longimicrobium sp.]|jgi:hypothetical protein
MRQILFAAALLACATPALAQHNHAPAQQGAEHSHEGGQLPDGWKARPDRADSDMSKLHFMPMSGGFHAITGPAAIVYRPADQARGVYTVQARFNQRKAPTHPEAYGIFYGGRNLETGTQEYFYFLVRGDGKYAVKHRAGSEVHDIRDWTEHAAIHKQDRNGRASNLVSVAVNATAVTLIVNGTRVAQFPRTQMGATDGVHGLRINHNLDVLVDRISRR